MKCKGVAAGSLICMVFWNICAEQINGSFTIGGQVRNYILYVPSGASNAPLVINMHGLTSNASQQLLYTQFNAIADREKCMVVYPNGINNSWDLTGSRDVDFMRALIDTIDAHHPIDRSRVYATGMSMGGYMSHKLGCQMADRIAAIASVAGLNAQNAICNPSRAVPVLQIHGTADNIVPYSGVAATISGWVQRNGCPQTAQVTDPYPASKPNSVVKKELYGFCRENSEVALLTIEGGGHAWPGGLGAASDINASEEVWAFLKRFSLPSSAALSRERDIRESRAFIRRVNHGIAVSLDASPATTVRLIDISGKTIALWRARHGGEAALPWRKAHGTACVVAVESDRGVVFSRIVAGP